MPLLLTTLPSDVDDGLAVLVHELFAGVAEVEVELAVGAEDEGVDAVVVLDAADAGEEDFLLVGLAVAVGVGEDEDVGAQETMTLLPRTQMPRAELTSVPW